MNISRTPVREAILQLQHENMVEVKANRGIIIKPLYLDEIKKIVEARLAIEGYSASKLAENISSDKAKNLVKILEQNIVLQEKALTSSKAYYKFMTLDLDFHRAIIDFTDNTYFMEMIRMLRARLEVATLKSLHEQDRLANALNEHKLLVTAIKTGDPHKAFKSFDFHMQKTLEIMDQCYGT